MSHPLVAAALADVGRVEGDPDLPIATRARPWCAAACSTWLRACGVAIPVVWGATSLMRLLGRLGYSVPHDGELAPGDVVGWERFDRAGDAIGAHVAIVVEVAGDRVRVIAGNSGRASDRVAESWQRRGRVTRAARVPV